MKKVDAWSAYWFSPVTKSFLPERFEQRITTIWEQFGKQLPAQSSVLDVCCGNGAVASALEQADISPVNIVGVDVAKVSTDNAGEFTKHTVEVHPETDVTALPFADSTFQGIASQFGLEYTDLDKTLSEIARVAAAGAECCFIVHAKNSMIEKSVASQLQACELIEKSGFFHAYAEFFELLDESSDGNQLSLKIRIDEMNKKLVGISSSLSDAIDQGADGATIVSLLEFASHLFEQRQSESLEQQLKQLMACEIMNRAAAERARNMLEVGLSDSDVQSLSEQCRQRGIDIASQEISDENGIIAYHLTGKVNG